MDYKKLIKFYPIPLAIGLIFFCQTSLKETRAKCYESEIGSIVVARKNNCTLGAFYDYECKSGDILYVYGDDTLLIGDSILKMANSEYFDVYRKNNGGDFKYLRRMSIPDYPQ
jgi:hypothetical protein|tara:strand:- start:547 stop:885 length:339 start_codon:yes stop_codon:yes gene_type:complete